MSIGSKLLQRALVVAVASAGLAGCVAYPAPGYYAAAPAYDGSYAAAPVYAAPAPYYYAPPVYGGVVIGGGCCRGGGWGRHWR